MGVLAARLLGTSAALTVATITGSPRADGIAPPWVAEGDVPPPSWARTVAPKHDDGGRPGDLELFVGPSRASGKRGVTAVGATLPFFGERRGAGCSSPWWLVGPLAWTCADDADLTAAEPIAPLRQVDALGLSAQYYFVTSRGADAYDTVEDAESGSPNRELDGGWGVAVTAEQAGRVVPSERWAHTTHGLWIAMSNLGAARPSAFHGEALEEGKLDFAWVTADRAGVWPDPKAKGKPSSQHARFERVPVLEGPESTDAGVGAGGAGAPGMVRVGDGAWMQARDLARPSVAAPPAEVVRPGEHWIDVDLATQTLVAYEGARPVYATLVSSGRGAPRTPSATPTGVHRVWVKILASDMGNAARDDEEHYSLEDVPYVQFFDSSVALHGTYWHGDFGHVRSHGCVNLAPLDAQWLFAFTEPHLPVGWVAVYPTVMDEGSVVRVRSSATPEAALSPGPASPANR
ncbi:MAG TPA: L,D-transpeptidase [Polyangiaceae bacterium]|nr:L,D-transpeptidase [Polyangiaceae bacterium]